MTTEAAPSETYSGQGSVGWATAGAYRVPSQPTP
jgi:hypothetical protein